MRSRKMAFWNGSSLVRESGPFGIVDSSNRYVYRRSTGNERSPKAKVLIAPKELWRERMC